MGYSHATAREFQNYEPVEIAGRQVFLTSEDGLPSYILRVGPAFDPVADGYDFEDVPAVRIQGQDHAAVEKAVTAVLEVFPGAG